MKIGPGTCGPTVQTVRRFGDTQCNRHTRYGRTSSEPDIRIHKPGSLDSQVHACIEFGHDPRNRAVPPHHHLRTYLHTEERRSAITVVKKSCSNSVKPLSLKIKSANRYPKNADPRTYQHVAEPMLVVQHTRNTRHRSHRITGDTVPGTAAPVLLMKHRSRHKSRSRMPRRERLVVRSVGTGHTASIFQRIDRSGHQSDGKASDTSIRPHELRPRTPPIFSPSINAAGAYCR